MAQGKSRAKPLRDMALKLFVLSVGATGQGYFFQAPFPRQALPAARAGRVQKAVSTNKTESTLRFSKSLETFSRAHAVFSSEMFSSYLIATWTDASPRRGDFCRAE